MKSGELWVGLGWKLKRYISTKKWQGTNEIARCQKIFLVPNADTIEICRDLLHLWSRMYRQLYLVDTQLGVKHLLLIILDARFVRLQKSNHAEARDASFLIITYRLRVLARAKEYITHQEPIYVKLLPIFVAIRGLAPPKPLFDVDTFVVSRPYYKSEIRISL